jgi:hypothetical protein
MSRRGGRGALGLRGQAGKGARAVAGWADCRDCGNHGTVKENTGVRSPRWEAEAEEKQASLGRSGHGA